jgi:hypothetical protein
MLTKMKEDLAFTEMITQERNDLKSKNEELTVQLERQVSSNQQLREEFKQKTDLAAKTIASKNDEIELLRAKLSNDLMGTQEKESMYTERIKWLEAALDKQRQREHELLERYKSIEDENCSRCGDIIE